MSQTIDAVGNLHDQLGQFAGHIQTEGDADTVLAGPSSFVPCRPGRERFEGRLSPDDDLNPTVGKADRGATEIDDTVRMAEEPIEAGDGRMLNRMSFAIGGEPHRRARNLVAASMLADLEDPDTLVNKVEELARNRSEATMLTVGPSGTLTAYEGRPLRIDWGGDEPRLVWQAKGSRGTSALALPLKALVSVQRGFGGAQGCAERFADVRSRFVPKLDKIESFDDVPEYRFNADEDAPSPKVAAVYMIGHGFSRGGEMPGCLFFATDRQPGEGPNDEDIINGYFWAPDRTPATMHADSLTPEHGSFYGSQLRRAGGKVADFEPGSMTFRDCVLNTIPDDRGEAYRRVMGVSYHDDECGRGRW